MMLASGDSWKYADKSFDGDAWTVSLLYICSTCHRPTLVEQEYSLFTGNPFEQNAKQPSIEFECERTIYPPLPPQFAYISEFLQKELLRALEIRHHSANAFAVQVGRVLEVVCTELGSQGKTLADQLEYLVSEGTLPGLIGTASNHIRVLRNVGAHSSLGEVTKDEADSLYQLLLVVLEYVYVVPCLLRELQISMAVKRPPTV